MCEPGASIPVMGYLAGGGRDEQNHKAARQNRRPGTRAPRCLRYWPKTRGRKIQTVSHRIECNGAGTLRGGERLYYREVFRIALVHDGERALAVRAEGVL